MTFHSDNALHDTRNAARIGAYPKALITGASSGIGAIYADRLARRGYDLILVARDHERLRHVGERITTETNRLVEFVIADLTDNADLRRVEELLRADASIDLLVNNAGSAMTGDLASMDAARLDRMILLNVLAPTRLAAAVIPQFVSRGHGTIVNLSSAVALAHEWINGVYSGTKAYLLNLTRKLHQELAGKGIRVQAVLPGAVRTDMWEKAGTDLASLSPEILMDAGDMVDAALAGLDRGEVVTIPALQNLADWEAYDEARVKLLPQLSKRAPAERYRIKVVGASA
jgi:short-subunit dehydrogenase